MKIANWNQSSEGGGGRAVGVGASGKSWEQAWVQVSSSLATAHDSVL